MTRRKLKDKVVIVTGSGRGIGKYVANSFLSRGAKVVFSDIDKENMKKLKKSIKSKNALFVEGDLTIPKECKKLIEKTKEKFGKIDVLINNAGKGFRGDFYSTHEDSFKKVLDINLMSAVYCTKYALNEIKKSKGSIVFISSVAGIRGIPYYGPYSVAKSGVNSFAEILRMEHKKDGIHVGSILLGPTEVEKGKTIINSRGEKEKSFKTNPMISLKKVERKIRQCILKRKKVMILTNLTKAVYYGNRISPGFLSFVLRNIKDRGGLK